MVTELGYGGLAALAGAVTTQLGYGGLAELLHRGTVWWREVEWRWDFVVGFAEVGGQALP